MVMSVWRREWQLLLKRPGDWCLPITFFLLVAVLFPMGVAPEVTLLQAMGPGVMWVGALLSNVLAASQIFRRDYEAGIIDYWLVAPLDFVSIVAVKCFIQWLIVVLPMVLTCPVVMAMYQLSLDQLAPIVVAILLGSVGLVMVGVFGAALTVSLGQASVLMTILVLPLYVPILILGAGACRAALLGSGFVGHLALLGAVVILCVIALPWLIAWAVKIQITESI